jgi:hypothetical protein
MKADCPPKIFERGLYSKSTKDIHSRTEPLRSCLVAIPNFPTRLLLALMLNAPRRRPMLVWRRGVVAGPVMERHQALLLRLRRRGSAVPPHPSDPWWCYCISSDPLFHVLCILTVSCFFCWTDPISLAGCSHGWNARMTAEEIGEVCAQLSCLTALSMITAAGWIMNNMERCCKEMYRRWKTSLVKT